MHPAITRYKNFYTLDGYSSFYPNTYHKEFREIIQFELRKNEMLREYYESVGDMVAGMTKEYRNRQSFPLRG